MQENDYGYLDRNYGINEITTYGAYDYAELTLKEKEVYSSTYDFLLKKKKRVDADLKTLLLEREKTHMAGHSPTLLKTGRIEALKKASLELQREMSLASQKIDKAEKLIGQGRKRLALDAKQYMDVIKITARNIFYALIAKFRPYLDNYRDDHLLLRELTRAPGYIEYGDTELRIQLHPDRNYQPRQKKAILAFLAMISHEINEKRPDRLPVKITLSTYMDRRYPKKNESV